MKPLLLIFSCFIFSHTCFSQSPVQLHLKKNGHLKKRIQIGDEVLVATKQKEVFKGEIIKLNKDSIYFRHAAIAVTNVIYIKFPKQNKIAAFNWKLFGTATLGVGLITAGLVAADWKEFPAALGIAATIGYSPFLFQFIKSISLRKHKFKMGKRYTVFVWDIR